LCDNSGSMRGDSFNTSRLSLKSACKTSDIANLFGTMYWHRAADTYFGIFGDRLESPSLDRKKGVFENYKIVDKVAQNIGGATELGIFMAMEELVKQKKIVDRIIIFSDCQCGSGCAWYGRYQRGNDFNQLLLDYRKINPDVKVYSVDLQGYGNAMIEKDAVKVAGWSDHIFTIIEMAEKGTSFVEQIKKISL